MLAAMAFTRLASWRSCSLLASLILAGCAAPARGVEVRNETGMVVKHVACTIADAEGGGGGAVSDLAAGQSATFRTPAGRAPLVAISVVWEPGAAPEVLRFRPEGDPERGATVVLSPRRTIKLAR